MFSVSMHDKTFSTLLTYSTNGIDGLKKLNENYLESWQYNMFVVDRNGTASKILDTSEGESWNADFELIKEKNIIVAPTLGTNKIIAYRIEMN